MFARCEHSGEIAAILLQNSLQNSVSTILQAKSLYVNAALNLKVIFNYYIDVIYIIDYIQLAFFKNMTVIKMQCLLHNNNLSIEMCMCDHN